MRRLAFSLALAFVLSPHSARAQFDSPAPAPEGASQLNQRRAELVAQLDALRVDIARLNQRCSHVADTDKALTQECQSFKFSVQAKVSAYKAGLSNYESDPMVVDARNVPSGLPQSVEAAIPHTPAGDRLRKGYEAVLDHDWKVARAWFQDARNHAPGDAGIARVVELALEAEARQAGASANSLDRYAKARHDASSQTQWKDFAQKDLPRHPELTAAARQGFGQTAPRPLSEAETKVRVAQLKQLADAQLLDSTGHLFNSLFLAAPGSPQARSEADMSTAQVELATAMDKRAQQVAACKCEPPLQLPQDSDIQFLFLGAGP
jgi:hypothetical protein